MLLRRRRRPARLPRRRRARHDARAAPSAGRRAVGLRHGARRRARAAAAGARDRALGGDARSRRRPRSRRWRRRRAPTSRRRGSPRTHRRASARCTSSTRAPTPRSRRASDNVADVVAEFERKYRQQYGFLMPGKPLVVEAVAVEAIGRTHDAQGRRARVRAARRRRSRRSGPTGSTPRARSATPPSTTALHLRPGDAVAGPAVIREHNATTVVEPGWRATLHRARRPRARARRGGAARARDRHDRRSGAARGLQQPVHGDRRADGRDARQHRVLGQHQGAARFLLRAVRRRRQPRSPTRRTCRCIWARWARA